MNCGSDSHLAMQNDVSNVHIYDNEHCLQLTNNPAIVENMHTSALADIVEHMHVTSTPAVTISRPRALQGQQGFTLQRG